MNNIFKFLPSSPPSVTDDKDDLCAFVDSLNDNDGDEMCPSSSSTAAVPPIVRAGGESTTKEEEAEDIWPVMSNAFDSWLTCIVDVESRLTTDHSFKNHRIDQAIQRMLEDGLIGVCDANELRFVGDSWIRLLNSYSYFSIGCRSYRRDVVAALLDLFSARQITKTAFLNVCEQL